jgi:predicted O-methyltransferase YrrM
MKPITDDRWPVVDRYITDQLVHQDVALESTLQASAAAGLPAINVSPNQGKLLFLMAKALGARSVLELGTLGGYSAIWLARALPAGGRLVTIELNAASADIARRNFLGAGCSDVVDLRVGPALEILPRIEAERLGPFDFIFIDADKINYPQYLTWSIRLARAGSVIVADNVVREGAVADPASKDTAVQGIRSFYSMLAAEPRVSATAIQTVGIKGYDGFAVIVVTDAARKEARL